ncbi:MAG: hypothetical protein ACI945_000288 [Pseudohongiellaceae bacterium]|jgi:hypothetical protein
MLKPSCYLWAALGGVLNGLGAGAGTEIGGGLSTLFISRVTFIIRVTLRSGVFPQALNYLGLVVGVAGIVTIVATLKELTMVFGLGQIPWFIC